MKNSTEELQDYQPELVKMFEVEELEERMEFAAWSLSAKASNDGWEASATVTL
ncbi:hypothetical protein [Pedobacter sp. V48]|mgnify:CR=1 FL=1|jgi:hypothetical protein|uniref:hypothetical protein n=1 Tax=Pedobacter sp. V48 TaxID=509635 RepID=UPI0003E4A74A|nr:hypothetical protein [Pedobacter sp. V48]ETZ20312.1 hypothetical protein N824_08850 [Pedobacter sp. V48]